MRNIPLRIASTTSPSSSIFSSFSAMMVSVLNGDDVERLGALLTLPRLELDLGALGEGLEALAADAGVVDEEILTPVLRCDEAVALRIVEPLDCSCCHRNTPPYRLITNGKRGAWHLRYAL